MPKNKKSAAPVVAPKSLEEELSDAQKTRAMLNTWAHDGTLESIKKIENFIASAKDWEIQSYAEVALDEAKMWYYSPKNEQEEKDFLLAKMISEKEDKNSTLAGKIDAAKLELKRLALDKAVCDKLNHKKEKKAYDEEYGYDFSIDYKNDVSGRLNELESDLAFNAAWVEEAKKMIVNKKFREIPATILIGAHLDGEGVSFWTDGRFDEETGEDVCECCDEDFKAENIPF